MNQKIEIKSAYSANLKKVEKDFWKEICEKIAPYLSQCKKLREMKK